MKKYIVILLIPFLFACGREAKEKAAELRARNDSLINQTTQKDLTINDFLQSVNEIQGVLDSIKMKENIISQSTQAMGEMKHSVRNQIKSDIMAIYSQILKDKQRLDALYGKLKSSGIKFEEFRKLVDHLQREVAEKDSTLAVLRENMSKMDGVILAANHRIDTLSNEAQNQSQQISSQTKVIDDQTIVLNTGYYILGTPKELKKDNIIKGSKLVPDFNKSLFTRVDIRNTKEIPLSTKKVKLITNHPPSSYKLVTDGKMVKALQVTDEKAFWSASKYLVMVTN
jgi:predicted  nucleic acid-binding Zn-ribbon protein